jgi:Sortase domain
VNPYPTRRPVDRRTAWAVSGTIAVVVVAALLFGAFVIRSGFGDGARWLTGGDPSSPSPSGSPHGPASAPPTRLRIPAIDVDTPLESLGLDADGALRAPKDFAKAGWYVKGGRPGDVGPAIIAGHVDSWRGPAVFFRLHQLRPGATVEVVREKDSVKFRVLAVHRYPKSQFPTDEVYAPTPNAQLRLITCGGVFDNTSRSYLDNVVVYAVAV